MLPKKELRNIVIGRKNGKGFEEIAAQRPGQGNPKAWRDPNEEDFESFPPSQKIERSAPSPIPILARASESQYSGFLPALDGKKVQREDILAKLEQPSLKPFQEWQQSQNIPIVAQSGVKKEAQTPQHDSADQAEAPSCYCVRQLYWL